uniref:EOG090X0856 n=1 Tax=Daphnia lumholtzi TaxID=42856 RepID=A0A4Y7MFY3_9CRUS|nr:EOG090X0856 [Daphnia lumholtzi]SVE78304.1 EOG090X0856 [Daphnia lumholtzi]SVE78932.1 EOG090X0856 [Daphnia lumholtzi]
MSMAYTQAPTRTHAHNIQNEPDLRTLCRGWFHVVQFDVVAMEESLQFKQMLTSQLEKLIGNEKFVIVLFRDASPLVSNFTSGKDVGKPLVVYFRHGVPLLYDGPLNDEVMLETFVQNKEAVVSHLNDDSFEHLTQAASGATTGDWFVMFYRDDSQPCVKFLAKWEYIASQLKGRINLAKVNIKDDGISTGSRFSVDQVPAFLFFRQGKIFNYDLPKLDSKAFQDFALGWYKNVPSKNVPSPKTPFDELVDRAVFMLKENPLILPAAGIALILILMAVGFNAWKSRKPEKPTKTKKNVKKSN